MLTENIIKLYKGEFNYKYKKSLIFKKLRYFLRNIFNLTPFLFEFIIVFLNNIF